MLHFTAAEKCIQVGGRLVCMHAGLTGCCSGWRHCRTACIKCDTWDPGRASSRNAATTYSRFRRRYSLLVRDSVATGRQGNDLGVLGSWGRRSQEKLETQKRGPSGANWLAGGDAMSRQLGEGLASIFPTHPACSCAFLAWRAGRAGPAPRGLRGDALSDRLHVRYNRVNGLCFGQPASSQHPAPLAPIQSPSTAGIDHDGNHLHYLFL